MTIYHCACLLLCGLQILGSQDATTPRALYERSAELIAAQELDASAVLLERLVNEFPSSSLAEIAVVHLAEHRILQANANEAFSLLEAWKTRLGQSKTAEVLSPGIGEKSKLLQIRAAREAALEQERRQHYTDALSWLERAVASASEAETPELEKEQLRVRVAALMHETRLPTDVDRQLSALETASQIPIRFALAEALLAANDPTNALEQFNWLSATAHSSTPPLPDWLIAVELRRAELFIRFKDYSNAKTTLQQAERVHRDADQWHEFEFLLARFAIAEVDFPVAQKHLQSIIARPSPVTSNAHARAWWMLGEIDFMQKDYAQAVDKYQRALALGALEWQALSLLQMARCQELIGAEEDALAKYRKLEDEYSDSEPGRIAAVRLQTLRPRNK